MQRSGMAYFQRVARCAQAGAISSETKERRNIGAYRDVYSSAMNCVMMILCYLFLIGVAA